MDLENELSKGKVYRTKKKDIIKNVIIKVGIAVGVYILSIGISTRDKWYETESEETLFLLFLVAFLLIIMLFKSNVLNNYKTAINDEYIEFQHFIKFLEPQRYKWEDNRIIIIGNVKERSTRLHYDIYGIEIFYRDKYYNKLSSDVYKLDHLANYKKLINDIVKKCNKFNVKFEYSK